MRFGNANSIGNSRPARDYRPVSVRQSAHDLSRVFGGQKEKAGPVPERDVSAGWGPMVLLALRVSGGRVL